MSETPHFGLGDPIELPWWTFALATLPVLSVLAGLVIPQPAWLRLLAILPALGLIVVLIRVSTRVMSTSMQSVWISLAYGLWFIFPVAWVVALQAGVR